MVSFVLVFVYFRFLFLFQWFKFLPFSFKVEGLFYVNDHLEKLMFDELRTFSNFGGLILSSLIILCHVLVDRLLHFVRFCHSHHRLRVF